MIHQVLKIFRSGRLKKLAKTRKMSIEVRVAKSGTEKNLSGTSRIFFYGILNWLHPVPTTSFYVYVMV